MNGKKAKKLRRLVKSMGTTDKPIETGIRPKMFMLRDGRVIEGAAAAPAVYPENSARGTYQALKSKDIDLG